MSSFYCSSRARKGTCTRSPRCRRTKGSPGSSNADDLSQRKAMHMLKLSKDHLSSPLYRFDTTSVVAHWKVGPSIASRL
eukprot:COSAG02_NODE_604_length_19688_cov_77.556231_21_plen_79_part_00